MKDRLCGNVKLFFQPAEETTGGALPMVQAGVLENPRVDASYGLHLQPYLPLGTIETRHGALNAAWGASFASFDDFHAPVENIPDGVIFCKRLLTNEEKSSKIIPYLFQRRKRWREYCLAIRCL